MSTDLDPKTTENAQMNLLVAPAQTVETNWLNGDCREMLKSLPSDHFRTCVTSPPYYGVRDYGHAGQVGREATPHLFAEQLVAAFREVRRVLTNDGTAWLNIGDSFNNRTKVRVRSHEPALNGFTDDVWKERAAKGGCRMTILDGDLKEKDLFMVPAMVALALRSDGWWLRSQIVWHKPFGKPEPVHDRPSGAWESLFLLSKSKRYFYDENAARAMNGGSNLRNVWTIAPGVSDSGHGAVMPSALADRCIRLGSEIGDAVLDPFAGSGTTGRVASKLGRRSTMIDLNPTLSQLEGAA